jgi:hypothetical protein
MTEVLGTSNNTDVSVAFLCLRKWRTVRILRSDETWAIYSKKTKSAHLILSREESTSKKRAYDADIRTNKGQCKACHERENTSKEL